MRWSYLLYQLNFTSTKIFFVWNFSITQISISYTIEGWQNSTCLSFTNNQNHRIPSTFVFWFRWRKHRLATDMNWTKSEHGWYVPSTWGAKRCQVRTDEHYHDWKGRKRCLFVDSATWELRILAAWTSVWHAAGPLRWFLEWCLFWSLCWFLSHFL